MGLNTAELSRGCSERNWNFVVVYAPRVFNRRSLGSACVRVNNVYDCCAAKELDLHLANDSKVRCHTHAHLSKTRRCDRVVSHRIKDVLRVSSELLDSHDGEWQWLCWC